MDTGYVLGVHADKEFAYLAVLDSSLRIIDISDPNHPVEAGDIKLDCNVYDVYKMGDFAYLSCRANGIRIVNVSDPENPAVTAWYKTSGNAFDLAVRDNRVYVADGRDGLYIIRHDEVEEPDLWETEIWGTTSKISAFPNPLSQSTRIEYTVSASERVNIEILNLQGEQVKVIDNSYRDPGSYSVIWNTVGIRAGLYFCRLRSGNYETTVMLVVVK
jgi:hypothetical protein